MGVDAGHAEVEPVLRFRVCVDTRAVPTHLEQVHPGLLLQMSVAKKAAFTHAGDVATGVQCWCQLGPLNSCQLCRGL